MMSVIVFVVGDAQRSCRGFSHPNSVRQDCQAMHRHRTRQHLVGDSPKTYYRVTAPAIVTLPNRHRQVVPNDGRKIVPPTTGIGALWAMSEVMSHPSLLLDSENLSSGHAACT